MRKVIQISDLHFGRVDEKVLDPLRSALETLAPDLLVVSGDLTQRARKGQFRDARAYLDTLPKPQLVVPGNHDVPLYNLASRFLTPLRNYRRIITGDLDPDFIDEEIAVVGVNTARSATWKGGRINEKQVAVIREKICALPDEVVKIVVTHHPFDVPKDSHEGDQIVGRARMALEQLADCGADVFLSGHLHESHVGHTADRYRIAGLSALVVQAGTATSSRTRESPNSFNLLRLEGRHIEIVQYAWDGSAFQPGPVLAYDHDEKGWHHGEQRHEPPAAAAA